MAQSYYYFNKGALLQWKHDGGDYIDANSVPQGATPWATSIIHDTNSVYDVFFDVTVLTQTFSDQVIPNRGFLIKHNSGKTGPIDYATREDANADNHPTLTIMTVESGTQIFHAQGDTQLSTSSNTRTYGQDQMMRVTPGHNGGIFNALVWFDLTSIEGENIINAELKLTTVRQYSSGDAHHGVFATTTAQWDTSQSVTGIADGYQNDINLASHPDVYLSYSFNSPAAADGGAFLDGTADVAHVDSYWPCSALTPTGGLNPDGTFYNPQPAIPGYTPFEPTGDSVCYRLKYESGPANTQGLGNYGVSAELDADQFANASQLDELFVRYYLFLGDTWGENVNNEAGKLPGGITGRQQNTPYPGGWGGRTTNGANGWSARGGYQPIVPAGNNPLEGYTPIATYLYHVDQSGQYGDILSWLDRSPNGLLKRGRWYSIETQLKMNTRDGTNVQGQSGSNDGIMRGWVDGRLVYERTDIRFTDMDYIGIEDADLGLYYGGPGNTPWDQHIAIDNVVVSKSYIGPMRRQ